MSESYELSYGEVLYELRTYYGYKQKDLSNYLNITSQAYSNYENNKRTPDLEMMRKIAQFYNLTVDQLINYRSTRQIEDSGSYGTLFRGISDSGIVIPMTAHQAQMVTDLLSLSAEQQAACQKLIDFFKNSIS